MMSDNGSLTSTDTNLTSLSSYSSNYPSSQHSSLISFDSSKLERKTSGKDNNGGTVAQAITRDTYVRKLPYNVRSRLRTMLDPDGHWRRVCSEILDPTSKAARYTLDDIKNFELSLSRATGSPTDDFLNDWGTQNASLQDLLAVLLAAEMYNAANYLAIQVLNEPAVYKATVIHSPYTKQFGTKVDDVVLHYEDSGSGDGVMMGAPHLPEFVTGSDVIEWPYQDLSQLSGCFDDRPLSEGGHRIGTGGFANVYWAHPHKNLPDIAIKRLISTNLAVREQFQTELFILSEYRHDNLLPLLGYSMDGAELCLVYTYMSGGSLHDRLRSQNMHGPLTWNQRMDILIDTATALQFLHNHEKKLVHRDIKSANILLDSDCRAKLGDFGIAKLFPDLTGDTTSIQTNHVIGTSPYMPPEANRGTITTKMDVFALGVIMLEVFTGLVPWDEEREERDLISYIEENEEESDLSKLLDASLDKYSFPNNVMQRYFDLSKLCYSHYKKDRPDITWVLNELLEIKKCVF